MSKIESWEWDIETGQTTSGEANTDKIICEYPDNVKRMMRIEYLMQNGFNYHWESEEERRMYFVWKEHVNAD
jgi:hypothetical protein